MTQVLIESEEILLTRLEMARELEELQDAKSKCFISHPQVKAIEANDGYTSRGFI